TSLMFCANICSSLMVCAGAGGGGAGAFTVTRAVAVCVPPSPFALNVYVVESVGLTCLEPLAWTVPTPWSMLTSVVFVVCQVRVVDWPLSTVSGLAVSDAVGCGGGGGGGGGGGAAFLWHSPSSIIALSAKVRAKDLRVDCFNCFPPEFRASCDTRLHANVYCLSDISGIHA